MNAATAIVSDQQPGLPDMTLIDHLGELRTRIIICVVTLLTTICGTWFVALPIMDWFKTMIPADLAKTVVFVQLTPGEVLMSSFRVSMLAGIMLASPVILYQLLRFVLPGLTPKERKPLLLVIVSGSLLFVVGFLFGWFCVIPPALTYLLQYGQTVAVSQISIAQYIEFCSAILLLSGVVFELPLVLLLLAVLRLVNSRMLLSQWRTSVVIISVAAAVLTPSQDAVTMIVVAAAMCGLYFASLLPMRLIGR